MSEVGGQPSGAPVGLLEGERAPRRGCGTMELHQEFTRTNRDYVTSRRLAERSMLAYRRIARGTPPVITIPVVVHVVYNTPEQNISKAQIDSQIDILNRDFMALNSDRKSIPVPFKKRFGNPRLKFALAIRDPYGKRTGGITRTETTETVFRTYGDRVKFSSTGGVDAWPSDRYLNIWVCNLAGGLLGYATFPGSPLEEDGVVIGFKYFGTKGAATSPFNKGRTTTHEIGHWLNLLHIWGDEDLACASDDNVLDTPNQKEPNHDAPTFPHISCNNGPYGDMFMNYMDYTNDDVMCMFTNGQCERMRATLDGPRAAIQNSDALKKATKKTAATRLAPQIPGIRRLAGEQRLVFDGVGWVATEIR